ncbi:hypothetical protein, partial [Microbaculum marinisediminis]
CRRPSSARYLLKKSAVPDRRRCNSCIRARHNGRMERKHLTASRQRLSPPASLKRDGWWLVATPPAPEPSRPAATVIPFPKRKQPPAQTGDIADDRP